MFSANYPIVSNLVWMHPISLGLKWGEMQKVEYDRIFRPQKLDLFKPEVYYSIITHDSWVFLQFFPFCWKLSQAIFWFCWIVHTFSAYPLKPKKKLASKMLPNHIFSLTFLKTIKNFSVEECRRFSNSKLCGLS